MAIIAVLEANGRDAGSSRGGRRLASPSTLGLEQAVVSNSATGEP